MKATIVILLFHFHSFAQDSYSAFPNQQPIKFEKQHRFLKALKREFKMLIPVKIKIEIYRRKKGKLETYYL